MKNKGFTLIELIFVIVILSMLSLILVPTIQNLIKKNTDNMCTTLNESILSSAKDYMTNTRYENNYACYTEYTVSLETLINQNYIKGPIIDPRTKEELDTSQVVKFAYNCEINEFITYFKYEKCKSDYDENAPIISGPNISIPYNGSLTVRFVSNGGQFTYTDSKGNIQTASEATLRNCAGCGPGDQSSTNIPIPTKEGYVFGGWYYDNGTFLKIETTTSIYGIKHGTVMSYSETGILKVSTSIATPTLYAKWN